MKYYLLKSALILFISLSGCGTLLPGARRQVDVRKYAFSHDGSKVFYQENRYDYKLLAEKNRDRMYVYLYDVKKRKHRKIARSALLEVSPFGPIAYLGKDWKRKKSPDLVLFDYRQRLKRPVCIEGMPEDTPFLVISAIDWLSEEDSISEVLVSGKNPCRWRSKDENREKGISKKRLIVKGGEAALSDEKIELPQRKEYRMVSPDGRYLLKEEPIERFFMFHTSLYMEDRETGKKIYITKDSHLLSFFEGMGYLLKYMGFGIIQALGIT